MNRTATPWGVHSILGMFSPSAWAGLPDGTWVHAVCEPYTANRIVAAWRVLTGRAYAIDWPKAGDLERAIGMKGLKRGLKAGEEK